MSADFPTEPTYKGKALFIEHLAERIESMERGRMPLRPVAYRLYARRLREAMAGVPESRLFASLAAGHRTVADVLAVRHFDTHGWLPGLGAQQARAAVERLLRRLRAAR
jgi:hypothetical protein